MLPAPAPSQNAPQEVTLRDYLHVIRHRKWVFVLVTLLVTSTALSLSYLQTPRYRASARVLVQTTERSDVLQNQSGPIGDPKRRLQTESEFVRSDLVRDEVREQLGSAPPVKVTTIENADLLEITATDESASRAAEIANAYADAYAQLRLEQGINDALAASEVVRNQLADVQLERDQLAAPLGEIDEELAQTTDPVRRLQLQDQRSAIAGDIAPELARLDAELATLEEALSGLELSAQLADAGAAEVITRAKTPGSPFEPQPLRDGLVGLVVGLLLGITLAFFIDYLDDSVKTKDDIERVTGLPTLGLIPLLPAREGERRAVLTLEKPTSPIAEAYRSLATGVLFLGVDRPLQRLLVTSPIASEGKSSTVANLGVALARTGRRVLMVCCDWRRPALHDLFRLSNRSGFTSLLLGEGRAEDAVQLVPNQSRLALLASGPIPPDPTELLSSRRTGEILDSLAERCDVMLIDSPPVLPVADALILASHVDSVLLVATVRSTGKRQAHRAVELLRQIDAPLVGSVLNGVSQEVAYYTYPSRAQNRRRARRDRRRGQAEDVAASEMVPPGGNGAAADPTQSTADYPGR